MTLAQVTNILAKHKGIVKLLDLLMLLLDEGVRIMAEPYDLKPNLLMIYQDVLVPPASIFQNTFLDTLPKLYGGSTRTWVIPPIQIWPGT